MLTLRLLLFAVATTASLAAQTFESVAAAGTETREDDLPSIAAAPDGSLWLAFLSYSDGRDQIGLRNHRDGVWGSLQFVPNTSGDIWLPQVGTDAQGRVWVVWSQQRDENWDVYARRFDPEEQGWGRLVRLSSDPLPDVNPRLASDGEGGLAVVWQGWRGRHSQIFLRTLDGDAWSEPLQITRAAANAWAPAAAYDSGGAVWVAYDSYENGDYDVFLASVRDGEISTSPMAVAKTPRFEARATVAVDAQDRVWVAWEQGGPNWGKDTGYTIREDEPGVRLGGDREVGVRCYANGRLQQPEAPLQAVFAAAEGSPGWTYQPHVFADSRGGVWVAAKRRINWEGPGGTPGRGYWEYWLTHSSGDGWSAAVPIPSSWGRSSTRISAANAEEGLWLAWPTDNRTGAYAHRPVRGQIFAGRIGAVEPASLALTEARDEPVEAPLGHANEAADLDAIRGYRTSVHGRPVQIVRGDLHRHTELSWDGGGGTDGSLQDFYRYMIDAAAMDFGASTDHQGGAYDYWWRYTQKMTDMFHVPGAYAPLFGFERSVTQPNGHRNIFYAQRSGEVIPFFMQSGVTRWEMGENPQGDMPPVGTGDVVRDDTKHLYDAVRRMGGIAISHTSGTRMGTDWRDNDPELEPVVEIFQGARTNYEYVGAPLSVIEGVDDQHVARAGYHPEGFVRNAWEKGYRLGIITSSDHNSTHYSYAMVYTDRPTRQGILDAIRRRHTYGATDNILLDVRMGDAHFMGDELRASEPLPIRVRVRGTNALDKVHVIRGDKVLYTHSPQGQETTFEFLDTDPQIPKGLQYYYVRVEQKDGQMAWASPIWVNY